MLFSLLLLEQRRGKATAPRAYLFAPGVADHYAPCYRELLLLAFLLMFLLQGK